MILIDVLITLFTMSEREGVPKLNEYLKEASKMPDENDEEIQKNMKRNSKIRSFNF